MLLLLLLLLLCIVLYCIVCANTNTNCINITGAQGEQINKQKQTNKQTNTSKHGCQKSGINCSYHSNIQFISLRYHVKVLFIVWTKCVLPGSKPLVESTWHYIWDSEWHISNIPDHSMPRCSIHFDPALALVTAAENTRRYPLIHLDLPQGWSYT